MKIGNVFVVLFVFIIFLDQRANGMDFLGWTTVKNYSCGALRYGKEKIKNIFHNGSITLNGTSILETAQVNGRFDAQKARIAELDVNGSVAVDDCIIEGQAKVNGSVKALKSKFNSLLSVASEQVDIDSSVLHELKIRDVEGFKGTQVVKLHNGTKVLGPISFESGKGEVILYDTSEVGEIIGGTVSHR